MACPSCGYDESGDPAACGRCAFVFKGVPASASPPPETPVPRSLGPSRLPALIGFVIVSWLIYGVTANMTSARNESIRKMVEAERESGFLSEPKVQVDGEVARQAPPKASLKRADFDNLWKVYVEVDGVAMMLSVQQAVATKGYGEVMANDVKLGFKQYRVANSQGGESKVGFLYTDEDRIGPGTTYAPMSLMQALRAGANDPRIEEILVNPHQPHPAWISSAQAAELLKQFEGAGRKDADEPLKVMRRPAAN